MLKCIYWSRFLVACLFCIPTAAFADNSADFASMQDVVLKARQPSPVWEGSVDGPVAQTGKRIAVVVEDLRNGGVLGVAQGVSEASKLLEWDLKIFDAGGTPQGRRDAVENVLSGEFDGMILIGSDAEELAAPLERVSDQNIPVVGWHAGPRAGRLSNSALAVNVSTDPLEVARVTAMAAVVEASAERKKGVIIFTDSNFEIALFKSNAMADVIRNCHSCELLEIRDVAISESHKLMGGITQELLTKYGAAWTHALAINDIYFDYMMPTLIKADIDTSNLKLLSAGDGSAAAFQRILTQSYQVATVAEPLELHGWQLADELNRLLAGEAPDGYIFPVHLVTPENAHLDGGTRYIFDPENAYRDIYRGIWLP